MKSISSKNALIGPLKLSCCTEEVTMALQPKIFIPNVTTKEPTYLSLKAKMGCYLEDIQVLAGNLLMTNNAWTMMLSSSQ